MASSSASVLLLLCMAAVMLAQQQLSPTFYATSCPNATSIINAAVKATVAKNASMGASLLRLHFHDCFVQGCDGSVLLVDTATFTGEQGVAPNIGSLRGFKVIDDIKAQLEAACKQTISCADILTVAAPDAVVKAFKIAQSQPAQPNPVLKSCEGWCHEPVVKPSQPALEQAGADAPPIRAGLAFEPVVMTLPVQKAHFDGLSFGSGEAPPSWRIPELGLRRGSSLPVARGVPELRRRAVSPHSRRRADKENPDFALNRTQILALQEQLAGFLMRQYFTPGGECYIPLPQIRKQSQSIASEGRAPLGKSSKRDTGCTSSHP
ncbi:hypothetical protein ACP4OV_012596 [Aristida adscensionis]